MADDFPRLVDSIHRVFPASRLLPVGDAEVAAILGNYPEAPIHYLAFLRSVGYGRLGECNFMIYSGPCEPSEFFDPVASDQLGGIVFFGDDFAGWMVGFDTRSDWRLVGVDSATLAPYPEHAKTVGDFVAQRVSDFRPQ